MQRDAIKELSEKLRPSAATEKLWMLSVLAHNVTVCVRAVIAAPRPNWKTLSALNEIQHQITSRLTNLVEHNDEWDDGEFAVTLGECANRGGCGSDLDFAIKATLKTRSPADLLKE